MRQGGGGMRQGGRGREGVGGRESERFRGGRRGG